MPDPIAHATPADAPAHYSLGDRLVWAEGYNAGQAVGSRARYQAAQRAFLLSHDLRTTTRLLRKIAAERGMFSFWSHEAQATLALLVTDVRDA